jgi:hypothetical protein
MAIDWQHNDLLPVSPLLVEWGYMVWVRNTGAGFQESRAKRRMMQEYLRMALVIDGEAGAKAGKTLRSRAPFSEFKPQVVKLGGEFVQVARHHVNLPRLPVVFCFDHGHIVFDFDDSRLHVTNLNLESFQHLDDGFKRWLCFAFVHSGILRTRCQAVNDL